MRQANAHLTSQPIRVAILGYIAAILGVRFHVEGFPFGANRLRNAVEGVETVG